MGRNRYSDGMKPWTRITKRIAAPGSQQGFALLTVLVVMTALASIIANQTSAERKSAFAVSALERQVQGWLLAEAGLERALSAYLSNSDELRDDLPSDGTVTQWTFSGKTIYLASHAESGKVDLLAGDIRLVDVILDKLLGPSEYHNEVRQNILDFRSTDDRQKMMDLLDQISLHAASVGTDARRYLTVYSRQKTIAAGSAAEPLTRIVKDEVPDSSSSFGRELAIYTLSAQAQDQVGWMPGLDRVVSIDKNGRVALLAERMRNLPLVPDDLQSY